MLYAESDKEKWNALENVVAFLDGTIIGIVSPTGKSINQHTVYNGHKRKQALKFQAMTTPDGWCAHMYGLEVGQRHDMVLYNDSGVHGFLSVVLHIYGKKYMVYGHSGYLRRDFLEIPFKEGNMTVLEAAFNTAMPKAWVTVEWFL